MNKRNIALLGGSFDPITIAHLQIATEIYNQFEDIDEVWLVPCGDAREDKKLTKGVHRVEMINLMLKDSLFKDVPIKVEDIEIKSNKYIPTYDLLKLLSEKHEDCTFHFCIGSDLLKGIRSWKPFGERLVEEYDFIVMNRPGYIVCEELLPTKSSFINTNFEGSSTIIRQRIKENKGKNGKKKYFGINGLTTVSVIDYINKNDLYNEEIKPTVIKTENTEEDKNMIDTENNSKQEIMLRSIINEMLNKEKMKTIEMVFQFVIV